MWQIATFYLFQIAQFVSFYSSINLELAAGEIVWRLGLQQKLYVFPLKRDHFYSFHAFFRKAGSGMKFSRQPLKK